MVDAGFLLCFSRREAVVVENTDDSRSEDGFGLFDVGSRVPEIAKHIAATTHKLVSASHQPYMLSYLTTYFKPIGSATCGRAIYAVRVGSYQDTGEFPVNVHYGRL